MGGHASVNRTQPLFVPDHVSVLRSFAHARVLLAFDYDGTLSPIAPTPELARLPATTRRLLVSLANSYPCVVISGRALVDIALRVAGIGIRQVFGNHGLQWSGAPSQPHPGVREWVAPLRTRLSGQAGVIIEDKGHSVSVHFRLAPDHERALEAILPVVDALPNVRIICGAAAVNLLPSDGANKGVALRQAMQLTGCDRAIYVGDDDTDEDAFGALPAGTLLAIRVGPSPESRASYHVDSQESIDRLLDALIEARRPVFKS
jgi:trehalose 6-phosphate phosphatase